MFSISAYRPPSQRELRSFGWILTGGFFLIAVAPLLFRHTARGWALLLSALFAVAGLVIPSVLRPIHRIWMALGNILGWINSKIILGLIFYIVVTPVRFLRALTGSDPMNRKFDDQAGSYRVVRKPRDASHMKHQF